MFAGLLTKLRLSELVVRSDVVQAIIGLLTVIAIAWWKSSLSGTHFKPGTHDRRSSTAFNEKISASDQEDKEGSSESSSSSPGTPGDFINNCFNFQSNSTLISSSRFFLSSDTGMQRTVERKETSAL